MGGRGKGGQLSPGAKFLGAPKDYDVVELDSYTIDNTPHLASNSSKVEKIEQSS